jgi:hypothetical protein
MSLISRTRKKTRGCRCRDILNEVNTAEFDWEAWPPL